MRAAIGLMCLGVMAGGAAAHADVIFSDNFNDYTGTAYGSAQYATGLQLRFNGAVPGFTGSGLNASLAVDRDGRGDFAIMLYGGAAGGASDPTNYNAILLNTPIAANDAGVTYTVSFDAAPAVFDSIGQMTTSGDYIVFQLLDGLGANFANNSFVPPAFTATPGSPLNPFSTYSFAYVGDGVGNMTFNIFGVTAANEFAGAIDNLSISSPDTAVPEPASLALLGLGLAGVGLIRRRKNTV